jgi:hypothetical protein
MGDAGRPPGQAGLTPGLSCFALPDFAALSRRALRASYPVLMGTPRSYEELTPGQQRYRVIEFCNDPETLWES